ncbi:MAG: TSUP family transporter [Deltaproteobacteria bacterium]|nr:TSUP family transporter [Deltaproteobacteria bacterium]
MLDGVTAYVLLGVLAGTVSGLIGIGGAVIIIPALVWLLGFTQHQAQGTALALMVPPIGLLAAWTYYKAGYVDVKAALLICAGFFVGGLLGGKLAVALPAAALRRAFGVVIFLMSLRMIFGR